MGSCDTLGRVSADGALLINPQTRLTQPSFQHAQLLSKAQSDYTFTFSVCTRSGSEAKCWHTHPLSLINKPCMCLTQVLWDRLGLGKILSPQTPSGSLLAKGQVLSIDLRRSPARSVITSVLSNTASSPSATPALTRTFLCRMFV